MPNTLANPNLDRVRRGDALVEQLIASPAAYALVEYVVAAASPVNAVAAATASPVNAVVAAPAPAPAPSPAVTFALGPNRATGLMTTLVERVRTAAAV